MALPLFLHSQVLADAAPTITSVTPATASMAGGDTVVITGTNFTSDATVNVGGNAASTTFISDSELDIITPASTTAKAVDVVVTQASGSVTQTSALAYQYAAPTISSVTPPVGSTAGGNTVTINGSGFLAPIESIASNTGLGFNCGVSRSQAYCWGYNSTGQLGNGTTTNATTPTAVSTAGVMNGKNIVSVATSKGGFSLALDSNGAIYAWGSNAYGQFGNGTTTSSNVPVAVTMTGVLSGKHIIAIAAGNYASYALASDGTVYAWGNGSGGALGNGTSTSSSVPVAVTMTGVLAGKTITKIAAAGSSTSGFAFALASDGTLYAWGDNTNGSLGNGSTTGSTVPVAVSTSGVLAGKTITAVTTSSNGLNGGDTYALASDGTVYSWGYGANGALGNGTTTTSTSPVAVTMSGVLAGKTVTAVAAAGNNYTNAYALTSDGAVYAWGQNSVGSLGNGTTTDSSTPVAVSTSGVLAGKTITAIAAGSNNYGYALAKASDGTVYAWGDNGRGQFGNGSTTTTTSPVLAFGNVFPIPFSLTIDGATTSVASQTNTAIAFTAPAHAAGTVPVSLASVNAFTTNTTYQYDTPPSITSISPNASSNVSGGDTVDIYGANFVGGATATIGGAAVTNMTYVDSGHLRGTTPAHPTGGTVDVVVTNPDSLPMTLSGGFTYIGGTETWTGATSTDWGTASNWNGGYVPTSDANVIINGGTNQPTVNLSGGSVTVNSLSLGSSTASTLTESYGSSSNMLFVTNDFTIGASGVLTHAGNSTTQTNSLYISTGGNFTVASGGSINVSGKGYLSGSGPGAARYGSSYGGIGSSGGTAYGSITQPTDLGSGAYDTTYGGGAVRLTISGTLTLNGSINANGGRGSGSNSACGAGGGSVWITTGTLSGSGSITTNYVGTGCSPSGGGRIALYYATNAFSGSVQAKGYSSAGAGTIYKKTSAQTYGDLLIDNGGTATTIATPAMGTNGHYDNVQVTGGALYEIASGQTVATENIVAAAGTGANSGKLTVDNGATLQIPNSTAFNYYTITNGGTISGGATALTLTNSTWNQTGPGFPSGASLTVGASSTITFATSMTPTQALNLNSLTVQSGGTITTPTNTTTAASTLNFNVTQPVDIQSGGTINLDGKGYSTGNGSGKPTSGNAGGSYGGIGGIGNMAGATAGPVYGDQTAPTDMGSGGSAGAGGGALKLVSQGGINVNGTITANGGATNGSGGSIWLTATTVTGTGVIRANGAGSGTTVGGGAGGRVAFTYTSNPLMLDSLNGATGNRSGGDTLALTGSNFSAGTKVLIGGAAATTTYVDDHTLTVTTPVSSKPQTVDVTVYNQTFTGTETATGATGYVAGASGTTYPTEMPGSQTATQAQSFTYTQQNPNITSVSPSTGPATGGTNVAISGQAFDSFGRDGSTPVTANAWTNTGKTLPAGIFFGATTIVGNNLYSFGGMTGQGATATNAIYTASTSAPTTWTTSTNTLPASFGQSSVAVIGNKMYLFGGYTGSTALSTVYTANTSDPTTWTNTNKTLPGALYDAQVAIVGNMVYLFGGSSNVIYSAPVSDPTNWTNTGKTLPVAITESSFATVGGTMYLFGGYSNTILSAPVSDPTNWTNTGKTLPTTLAAAKIITVGNNLYIFGGKTGGPASTSVNTIYTASTSDPTTWTNTGKTLPGALEASQVAIAGGNLYLFGGYTTSAITGAIYAAPLTATGTDYGNYPWISSLPSPVSTITFGGASAINLEYLGATTLIATTPAHAGGAVDVATADSLGLNATATNSYTYIPAPVGSSLAPSSEPLAGGDAITLSGANFTSGDTVTVNGTPATGVNIVNNTTLTFTAPVGSQIGSAAVVVKDSLGQQSSPISLTYTLPAPTISSISPAAGPINGNQSVTVSGNGFYAPNSTTNSWSSAGTLSAINESAMTAVVGNTIYMYGGYNRTSALNTIYSTPVSNPTSWTNTGKTLPTALYGSSITVVGNKMYMFGGITAPTPVSTNAIYTASTSDPTTWTVVSGKTLPAAVSAANLVVVGDNLYLLGGVVGGTVQSTIYTASLSDPTTWTNTGKALPAAREAGQTITIGNTLYYYGGVNSTPTATNTILTASTSDPTTWATSSATLPGNSFAGNIVAVGNSLYMMGGSTGANNTTATNAIYAASVTNPLSWTSAGTLPGKLTNSSLVVVNGGVYLLGGYTGSTSTNVIYKAPVSTYAFPNQYNPTWTTNWYTDSSTDYSYKLTLGGTAATNVTVTNGSTLTATTPTHVAAKVDSVISNNTVSATLSQSYTFTPPPVITSFTPSSEQVGIAGDTMTITGTGFISGATVTIGGVSATITNVTNTMITAVIPTGTAVDRDTVTVTNTDGQSGDAASKLAYTLPAPSISSISPTMGPMAGSTNVTVTGSGFLLPNSTANTWTNATKTLADTSCGGSLAVIGNTIYMFGGNTSAGWSNAIYTAPTSDPTSWTKISKTLPAVNANSSLAIIGNNIYLFGGYNGTSYTNAIYTASTSDPTTWSTSDKTLPGAVGVSQLAIIGNNIYLFGGYNGTTGTNTIYTASTSDPTTWSNTGKTIPAALQQAQLAVIGNSIYLFGGIIGTSTYTNAIYTASTSDPTTWTTSTKTLPTTLWGSRLVSVGNSLYLLGGATNGSAYVNTIYTASTSDPTTWSNTGKTIPANYRSGNAAFIGNTLYYFGGYNGSSLLSTIASTPVNHTFPNQYNAPWTTNWYTDPSTNLGYHLTFDTSDATQVTATDATHLTAKTPAHQPAATDVQVATYDGNKSNTLTNGYTFLPDAYAFTNSPFDMMAGAPGKLTIEMRDANGNPVTGQDPITLQLASSSNSGAFAPGANGPWSLSSIVIPAGQSSVDVYYHDALEGTPIITATDPNNVVITQQETIESKYRLQVTGITNPTNVGVPSSVTVQAVDYSGTAQPDYRGTIHFTSTDGGASLPDDFMFTANDFGRHTFTNGVTFGTQGTWDVNAVDTTHATTNGNQTGIVVGPPGAGVAAGLTFNQTLPQSFPLDQTSSTITVQTLDSTGEPVVESESTTVYLRSDSDTGEFSVDNGSTWQAGPVAATINANRSSTNFLYRDTAAGTHTITASQNAENDFGWSEATGSVTVGVGAPVAVGISGPSDVSLGTWTALHISLRDSSDNSVNAPGDTAIHVSVPAGSQLSTKADGSNAAASQDITIPAGQQEVTVYLQSTDGDSVTVTASDARELPQGTTAYTDGTYTAPLGSGLPYKVAITPTKSTDIDYASQSVTVSLYDQFGNITTAEDDTAVSLSTGDSPYSQFQQTNITNWPADNDTADYSSASVTIPAGSSSTTINYRRTAPTVTLDNPNGTMTITGAAANLMNGTADLKITSGPWNGKINVDIASRMVNGTKQYFMAAGTTTWRVELEDDHGFLTTTDHNVTIGLAGTQSDATWQNKAVQTKPDSPGSWSSTITIPQANGYFDTTYKDTVTGTHSVSIWDTSQWQITGCSDYWGSSCLQNIYGNTTMTNKSFTVIPGAPDHFQFDNALDKPTITVKNTASVPLTVTVVDQFGNATSFGSTDDTTATITPASSTAVVATSANGPWNVSTITFSPNQSQATLYYKDSTVSSDVTNGDSLAISGGGISGSHGMRTIVGYPTIAAFDLSNLPSYNANGSTQITAGDYIPLVLTTKLHDNDSNSDIAALVVKDTSFTLASQQGAAFYAHAGDTNAITTITMPKNSSSIVVYYRVTKPIGNFTMTAAATGYSSVGGAVNVVPATVYKLAYTTTPSNSQVVATKSSSKFVVSAEDMYGNVTPVSTTDDTTVDVSSSQESGQFKGTGDWGDTSVLIPAGATASQDFYYKNGSLDSDGNLTDANILGSQTLTAHTDGLQNATYAVTITGFTPYKISYNIGQQYCSGGNTSGPICLTAGVKSGAITIQFQNTDGTPAPVDVQKQISLSAYLNGSTWNPAHGDDIYTDANGNQITAVTIPKGSSSATFYITPRTAQTHTIQADTSYINSTLPRNASLSVQVLPGAADHLVAPAAGATQTIYPNYAGDPYANTANNNETSSSIPVQLVDQFGNPTTEDSNRTVDLSLNDECAATGSFYANGDHTQVVNAVTITAGQSSTAVFYRDSSAHADACVITFASPTPSSLPNKAHAAAATQSIKVTERVAALGITSTPQTIEAGETSDNIVVSALDRFGNVYTATSGIAAPMTVGLTPDTTTNNTITAVSATIPAGGTTATFTFKHAAALTQTTTYTLTAADKASGSLVASDDQDITVTPGAPTALGWQPQPLTGRVGDWMAGTVVVYNADGYPTVIPSGQDIVADLSSSVGMNGKFSSTSTGDSPITSVPISGGRSSSDTIYYQQITTTYTRHIDSYGDITDTNSPTYVWANSGNLTAQNGKVSVSACKLAFSTGNISPQTSAFTAMHVSITGCALTGPLTVNLATDAGNKGGFYATANGTNPITSITITAQQTDSATFYYQQTDSDSHLITGSAVSSEWSTWDARATVSTHLGNVAAIQIKATDPATLEQNQTGTYHFTTVDSLGNPTPLVPSGSLSSSCLYARLDNSTEAFVTGSGSCQNITEPTGNVAIIKMTAGQTQGSITLHVNVPTGNEASTTGQHTLTIAQDAKGTSTVKGTKLVTITSAVTTKVQFDKSSYIMKRGAVLSLNAQLASQYGAVVNSLGQTSATINGPAGSEFSTDGGNTWQTVPVAITFADGQASLPLKYRNSNATIGTDQLTITPNDGTLGSSNASLQTVIGDYAGIKFTTAAQTLERQQTGTFALQLTDASGQPSVAATDTCVYLTVPSTTATIAVTDQGNCQNVALPGGLVAHAMHIAAGDNTVTFTLSDTTDGSYSITVGDQPTLPLISASQTVTIIDGAAVAATYSQSSYQMERGQVLTPRVQLVNAYGAAVPALSDTYLNLTSSATSGQFANSTAEPYNSSLIVMIPAGQSGVDLAYGDSNPQVGDYTLTVHPVDQNGFDIPGGSLDDSTTPLSIIYGAPAQIVFYTPPRTTTATHPSEVMTVEIQNQYGMPTLAPSNMQVRLATSSDTGQFATNQEGPWGITTTTISAGTSSTDVYYKDPTEGVYTMSATTSSIAQPATQQHTVVRQVMDHFVVTNISTPQKAGTPSSAVVYAVDADNYVVTWYTGTINFSADTVDAVYPQHTYTFTAEDRGTHTFQNAIAFKQSGIKAISVTDTTGLHGTQYSIIVGQGNTAAVTGVTFIQPSTDAIDDYKNTPTDDLVLQLHDSNGTPTNATATGGFPLHLTSDSATGQFATTPDGPWTNALNVTVEQGLSYTTTPIYYRDSSAGTHTITASDWQDNTDDTAIQNDTLKVHIDELNVAVNAALYSADYTGSMRQNAYLFSHDRQGDIEGYLSTTLSANQVDSGDTLTADWLLNLTDGNGKTIDHQSRQSQATVQYKTPTLTPARTDKNYNLNVQVGYGQLTGAHDVPLQISPWLVSLGNVTYKNGQLSADIQAYNGGTHANAPSGDIIVPELGISWSFDTLLANHQLTNTTIGYYTLSVPISNLSKTTYQTVVSLHDAVGIIAQDSTRASVQSATTVVPASPAAPDNSTTTTPNQTTHDKPVAPAGAAKPHPVSPNALGAENPLHKFLRSPQAPTVVSGALFGLLGLVAVVLAYQAYREWKRSRWLTAIITRNNQLVADKDQFLNLAAHHLRTPITIMAGGAELMSALSKGQPSAFVTNVNRVIGNLRQRAEEVIRDTTSNVELNNLTEQKPRIARAKIFSSPIFWLPVILSIVLTLLANWAITKYSDQGISGAQILNQIFFVILGIVVVYTAVRLRVIHAEQRRLLAALEDRVTALNAAKSAFVRRVYGELASDVTQADALVAEALAMNQEQVYHSLVTGADRLKQLMARFALLDSIYRLAPQRADFSVDYAVDQALRELSGEATTESLQITDQARDLTLHQDRHLVTKVLETILGSMRRAEGVANITISGHQDKHGTRLNITGPSSDAPAEGLFSVYSNSANEEAGTIDDDSAEQRLDLYLDRIIVGSLGGEISAEKHGNRMRVSLLLPAA